jgi:Zn finger protein HypA/HybF involved in hydrogenase expression
VRNTIVLMIFLGLVTAGAWAQADVMLGPHNTNNTFGCQSCHAPHSQVLAGQGLYLWGLSVPNGVYTTYSTPSGNTMTAALTSGVPPTDTTPHTVLCLSCHDQTFNPVMGGTCTGTLAAGCSGETSPTTNMSTTIPGFTGSGDGSFTSATGGVASSAFNISSNHPVHALYPNIAGTPAAGYDAPTADQYWALQSASASFVDPGTTFTYGHNARLFLDPTNHAYIECGSCHNPHSQSVAVVTVNGVTSTVGTAHFVRGEYDNTQTQAAFCMSCHANMSSAWNGTGTQ